MCFVLGDFIDEFIFLQHFEFLVERCIRHFEPNNEYYALLLCSSRMQSFITAGHSNSSDLA